jgi:hypothetical protein
MPGTKVTADDGQGEPETIEVEDDYVIVCDGDCYVAHCQVYPGTGTHQLTIKKGKPPE